MPLRHADGMRRAFADALPAPGWASAAQAGILVALFDVRQWRGWRDQAAMLLDAAESARVQRRRFDRDRERLVLAYALHRLVLGAALGLDPLQVPLQRDDRGCPRLAQGIAHTSLSHADHLAAVAVARAGPVGIDIEPAGRAGTMADIAATVCHPIEALALAGLPEPVRGAALLSLWVRKEAVLKAAGIGLAHEMNRFQAPDGGLVVLAPEGARSVRVRVLRTGSKCMVAVAGPPDARIDSAWLRPRIGCPEMGRAPTSTACRAG